MIIVFGQKDNPKIQTSHFYFEIMFSVILDLIFEVHKI